jgi:hypothetical protein
MADYGQPGADKLNRIREALGRRPNDPLLPSRESRTRSELLGYYGPPSDVTAPADQDMWDTPSSLSGGMSGGGGIDDTDLTALPEPEMVLPYPDYSLRTITQSRKSVRATKRPDLPPSQRYLRSSTVDDGIFYGAAREGQSTRVWSMQWIPTFAYDDDVVGDLLVAFARRDRGGIPLYVYLGVDKASWEDIKNAESFGRAIGALSNYHRFESGEGDKYRELHRATHVLPDGSREPWVDWIFDSMAKWAAGRPNNESYEYLAGGYEKVEAARLAGVARAESRRSRAAAAAARRAEKEKGTT